MGPSFLEAWADSRAWGATEHLALWAYFISILIAAAVHISVNFYPSLYNRANYFAERDWSLASSITPSKKLEEGVPIWVR